MQHTKAESLYQRALREAGTTYKARITLGSCGAKPREVWESRVHFGSNAAAVAFAGRAANIFFPPEFCRGRYLAIGAI